MRLNWVTSEDAECPMRGFLESYNQQHEDSKKLIDSHLARPHVHIPSLPNPAEPLEIDLPPNIKSNYPGVNVQNIANLWMQLLSINTQNGNFIRYDKWHDPNRTTMCISQMNPKECEELYKSLREADPPVEEAVAALICSIPYSSERDECHKIAPCTLMPSAKDGLERALFLGGPILPPHLMRLTEWWGGTDGMAILVDVLSGEGVELEEYHPNYDDGQPQGKVMTEYNGPEKGIEELLGEWIDNYLTARWMPDGSMDIMQIEWRNMTFLRYKALFDEYNWPTAFPLPQSQFDTFLHRHWSLSKTDHWHRPLSNLWHRLNKSWFSANQYQFSHTHLDPTYRRLSTLDNKISEALSYHETRAIDEAYAEATGGEIDERYRAPVRLHDSADIGDDWRVDVTAADIMERFWEVIAVELPAAGEEDQDEVEGGDVKDDKEVLEELQEAMEAAYHRYLDPEEANREVRMVGVPEIDDDSTSDFEVEDDDSSDTMSVSDEGGEENDLDVNALRSNMNMDVETIREQFAESQVSMSESESSQMSSQTLRGDESTQDTMIP